jgi:hypothetical protein
MIKDGQDSDRPRVHKARGLDRKKLDLKRKRARHVTMREHSSIKRTKVLGGVKTLHRGLGGYTRWVRSHAPTGKSYDATTPVHDSLSLCESDPHSPKGLGATVGYQKQGVPTINDQEKQNHAKSSAHKNGMSRNSERNASTMF